MIKVRTNGEHLGEGGDRDYRQVRIPIGKVGGKGGAQEPKQNTSTWLKSTWLQNRASNRHRNKGKTVTPRPKH